MSVVFTLHPSPGKAFSKSLDAVSVPMGVLSHDRFTTVPCTSAARFPGVCGTAPDALTAIPSVSNAAASDRV